MNYTLQWSPPSAFLIKWTKESALRGSLHSISCSQQIGCVGVLVLVGFFPCTCSDVSGRFFEGQTLELDEFLSQAGMEMSRSPVPWVIFQCHCLLPLPMPCLKVGSSIYKYWYWAPALHGMDFPSLTLWIIPTSHLSLTFVRSSLNKWQIITLMKLISLFL